MGLEAWPADVRVKTLILCGGRGTRLREYTETVPKVLVEIGGKPILWHIMKGYAQYGFVEFVLAVGYLGDQVREKVAVESAPTWSVRVADTGLETGTGGRVLNARDHLDGGYFFATYGDGLADIDLTKLRDFHQAHGHVATVTVVRPRIQFGVVTLGEGGRVDSFKEKPQVDGWVNGGYFVFDDRVFGYLSPDSILEGDVLQRLVADGELMAYPHDGYWACMDTYKDTARLNAEWAAGNAAWRTWEADGS